MGTALVIMVGYDDLAIDSEIDAILAEATAQGVQHVFWLTYHTSTEYRLPDGSSAADLYERHNASLRAAAARHPTPAAAPLERLRHGPSGVVRRRPHPPQLAGAVALARFIKDALDAIDLGDPCSAAHARTGVASTPIGAPSAPATAPAGYTARTPVRVLDTRDPTLGGADGKLGGGRTVTIDVATPSRPGRRPWR